MRVGANVQSGQEVAILCQVEHAPTARAIVREAYKAGARRVIVRYADAHIRRAAIELGPEDMLDKFPEHQLAWVRSWRETRPALIQLTGDAEPELFADLDPALVGKSEPRDLNALYRPLVAERLINWAIVASPNAGWATSVFGEPDLERLWEAVGSATRLDAADPVAAWREHDRDLKARSAQLNERRSTPSAFGGPERSSSSA